MYIERSAGGRGLGKQILEDLLAAARRKGFVEVWLETNSALTTAAGHTGSTGFSQFRLITCCPAAIRRFSCGWPEQRCAISCSGVQHLDCFVARQTGSGCTLKCRDHGPKACSTNILCGQFPWSNNHRHAACTKCGTTEAWRPQILGEDTRAAMPQIEVVMQAIHGGPEGCWC